MSESLLAILSVLVGALIGGGITLLVEHFRSVDARRATLRERRRQVELDALEVAHRVVRDFRLIFSHNHDGTDDDADEAQAAALEEWYQGTVELDIHVLRVRALASPSVADTLERIPDRMRKYWDDIEDDGRFLAAKIIPAVDDLEAALADLLAGVRADLGTNELD